MLLHKSGMLYLWISTIRHQSVLLNVILKHFIFLQPFNFLTSYFPLSPASARASSSANWQTLCVLQIFVLYCWNCYCQNAERCTVVSLITNQLFVVKSTTFAGSSRLFTFIVRFKKLFFVVCKFSIVIGLLLSLMWTSVEGKSLSTFYYCHMQWRGQRETRVNSLPSGMYFCKHWHMHQITPFSW